MSSPVTRNPWAPRSGWHGILEHSTIEGGAGGCGVVTEPREGLAVVSIIARSGQRKAASRIAVSNYKTDLPSTPRVARGVMCDFAWAGPESWLAIASREDCVDDLAAKFADCAAVADLSHARAILRVSGRNVRETLAKGFPIDLHPRAFSPGSVAITSVSHIGATIWQVDDEPTYDILIFRSLAKSFWTWLSASAAEFGLDVRHPRLTPYRSPGIRSV